MDSPDKRKNVNKTVAEQEMKTQCSCMACITLKNQERGSIHQTVIILSLIS
jgi:hypothetical protein